MNYAQEAQANVKVYGVDPSSVYASMVGMGAQQPAASHTPAGPTGFPPSGTTRTVNGATYVSDGKGWVKK
jgi:hypothetical protein